jgi:hypothetical protein
MGIREKRCVGDQASLAGLDLPPDKGVLPKMGLLFFILFY